MTAGCEHRNTHTCSRTYTLSQMMMFLLSRMKCDEVRRPMPVMRVGYLEICMLCPGLNALTSIDMLLLKPTVHPNTHTQTPQHTHPDTHNPTHTRNHTGLT